MEWKRGPQPPAAGDVESPEALVGVIEELMNTVRPFTARFVTWRCPPHLKTPVSFVARGLEPRSWETHTVFGMPGERQESSAV